jgi:hypothetical protein
MGFQGEPSDESLSRMLPPLEEITKRNCVVMLLVSCPKEKCNDPFLEMWKIAEVHRVSIR